MGPFDIIDNIGEIYLEEDQGRVCGDPCGGRVGGGLEERRFR